MVQNSTFRLPILSASLPKGIANTMDVKADPVTIAPKVHSFAPFTE